MIIVFYLGIVLVLVFSIIGLISFVKKLRKDGEKTLIKKLYDEKMIDEETYDKYN